MQENKKINYRKSFELEFPNSYGLYELNVDKAKEYGIEDDELIEPENFRCASISFFDNQKVNVEEEGYNGKII